MRIPYHLWGAVALAVVLTACSGKEKRERQDQAQYKTMTVKRSSQTLQTAYTAQLIGKQRVEVRPQVSGCITKICIGEGQPVAKGQTLFVIDQVPYQAALEVAEANVATAEAKLATAQMTYDSNRELKDNRVVSDYEVQTALHQLNEAKSAVRLAKAQALSARNNLSYTVVKSPVSGSASLIPYHVGQLVSPSVGTALVTVADDSEVYAYFSVTEREAMDLTQRYGSTERFIRQAPPVGLQTANGTMYAEQGRIDAVSGTVDDQTGAVGLRAVFPNRQHLLRSGGSGSVIVPTHLTDCIVIPQEATYELQNRTFVYRVVDGKTKATSIQVLPLHNGREYIVTEGLQEGDVIVSEGAGLLREGVEITEVRGKK